MRCPDACPCSLPRGTGAVYKKRAGVVSRHHDDTMMRDENRVKKCKKYLILLNKLAGVVQWQNGSFPSCIRGFDSLRPLQSPWDFGNLPGQRLKAVLTKLEGKKDAASSS